MSKLFKFTRGRTALLRLCVCVFIATQTNQLAHISYKSTRGSGTVQQI